MIHIEQLKDEKLKILEKLFASRESNDISCAFNIANQLPLLEKRFLKYHLNRIQKEWEYKVNKHAEFVREKTNAENT